MNNVTVKDLRDLLQQRHNMRPDYDPNPVYAAFDAMAEKAELLDKAEKYLQQTIKESRLASIARSDRKQFKIQIGKLGYPAEGYGNTLAEALKAVPE